MVPALIGVVRFDDALPDLLFETISAMAISLSEGPNPKGTFWQYADKPARTSIAAVISRLSQLIPLSAAIVGVEWWVRLKPVGMPMALHFDKDEALVKRTGQICHPAYSGILYLTDVGGPTVIIDQSVSKDGRRLFPPESDRGVLSQPKRNTFLAFPGHLRHGVVADLALTQNATLGAKRGSLLMNWWMEQPHLPNCGNPPLPALAPWVDIDGPHIPRMSPLAAISMRDLPGISSD